VAASEAAVVFPEKMHIAFDVADRDIVADDPRTTGAAAGKLILLPDTGAIGEIERMNGTLLVGHEDIPVVEIKAPGAGKIARPQRGAVAHVETGDRPW
jgi:hypothetical protein